MKQSSLKPPHTGEDLRHALADLVRDASPQISKFAAWALEHPDDIAFYSIRALADRAGTNVNTVYRFAIALGFPGFEACKRTFQTVLMRTDTSYGTRAAKLVGSTHSSLIDDIRSYSVTNLESMLSAENTAAIHKTAALLTEARTIYCMGVRSSFSLAHYLAYSGRMAFPNFARPVVEVGSALDLLTEAGPEDVVVLITFSLYSQEIVRAHKVARAKGVRIIALTDGYTSPIAAGALHVFTMPMQGPQTLPSLTAGFALVEALVNEMICLDTEAPARVAQMETRLLDGGAYVAVV